MKNNSRVAAEQFVTVKGYESGFNKTYTDFGNDGILLTVAYAINEYRDSEPKQFRFRHGYIYNGSSCKLRKCIGTYDIDGDILLTTQN